MENLIKGGKWRNTRGEKFNTLKNAFVQWNADKFGNHYKIPIQNDKYNKK